MISSVIKLLLLTLCIAVVNSTLEFMDFKPYIQVRDGMSKQLETITQPDDDSAQQAGKSDTESQEKETTTGTTTQPISPGDW